MAIPSKSCPACQFYAAGAISLFKTEPAFCRKFNHIIFTNEAPNCPAYTPWGAVQMRPLSPTITSSEIESLDAAKLVNRLNFTQLPLGTDGYFLKGTGVNNPEFAALVAGDIPALDAAKITTGILDLARIPTMDDAHIPSVDTLSYGVAFALAQIPSLPASQITSGLFDLARIPRVDLTKIPLGTSGYFLKGQGAGDAIYALLAAGDIPSLDAAKITSGEFAEARIPSLTTLSADRIRGKTSSLYLLLGLDTDVNMFLDRDYIKGQFIFGYNTPKGDGADFEIFQIYNNATDRVKISTIHSPSGRQTIAGVIEATGYKNTSPSRTVGGKTLGTIYQNTRGKVIAVDVTVTIATGAGQSGLSVYMDSTSSPTTYQTGQYIAKDGTYTQTIAVHFIVPDQWYYQVAGVGSPTLNSWVELTI